MQQHFLQKNYAEKNVFMTEVRTIQFIVYPL